MPNVTSCNVTMQCWCTVVVPIYVVVPNYKGQESRQTEKDFWQYAIRSGTNTFDREIF